MVIEYILEHFLSPLSEIIEKYGVPSLHVELLPRITRMASELMGTDEASSQRMVKFVASALASLTLGKHDAPVSTCIRSLFELAGAAADARCENVRDDVFRALGTIGSAAQWQVPSEHGFRITDWAIGYADRAQSAVFDELRSGFSELADSIKARSDDRYGTIWIDAILVTLLGLIRQTISVLKDASLHEAMMDFVRDFHSVAEKRALEDDGDVPWRVLMALSSVLREGQPEYLDEVWNSIAETVVVIGLIASDRHLRSPWGDVETDAFGVMDLIEKDISGVVLDIYIRSPAGHDVTWPFVKRLGVRRGTNFSMMFDPATGEDYAPDDPRRR